MSFLATFLDGVVVASVVPRGTRSYVFEQIYNVFLVLGTLVGVIVTAYMLHKAYKYRASKRAGDDTRDRPEVGEIPEGGGGGRKLFVSFALSAIIVISLISWTYFTLLYVENPDTGAEDEEPLEVEVVGHQFYWEFVYPNGHSERGTLRVPEDRRVQLTVTSADTFHNFGIPELRAKADAIPGERTSTWFVASSPGTYEAHCYELCGTGHSYMDATVDVMEPDAYQSWYADTANNSSSASVALVEV